MTIIAANAVEGADGEAKIKVNTAHSSSVAGGCKLRAVYFWE